MASFLTKLVKPWYPATAIGLDQNAASVVNLERVRGHGVAVRRAATFELNPGLIRPSFDEKNLSDPDQLASILSDLVTSAGLARQKRWSLTLPEASTRTLVLTLEGQGSSSEMQDVLKWKIERGFGTDLENVVVSKEKLPRENRAHERYAVVGMHKSVLSQYERVFAQLGWRVGLIVPKHLGEAQWLTKNGAHGDSLLLSGSHSGFTAVIFRDNYPLILRTVDCGPEEAEDELYRLLLFYRDRSGEDAVEGSSRLCRLMITGSGFNRTRAREIVSEAMGADLKPLEAGDIGLQLPSRDLSFDAIVAPAGLATLSL
jgi:Tfp pilus assembly PilM family ATPase